MTRIDYPRKNAFAYSPRSIGLFLHDVDTASETPYNTKHTTKIL